MIRKDFFFLPLYRFISTPMNKASTLLSRLLMLVLLMGMAAPAMAALTIEDITWGIKGLDSNDVSVGPNQYPVGARVCSDVDADVTVSFDWEDGLDLYTGDTYINLRTSSLSQISLSLTAGICQDAYFEVEILRDSAALDLANNTRVYIMTVDDDNSAITASTPTGLDAHEVYLEFLISQSRNDVTDMLLDGVSVDEGATMTLMVGQTYNITLVATTATNGYEQLESFISFPNVIFQVLSVSSSYTAPVGGTSDRLYGDACTWDADPSSDNYLSCLATGKVGGNITVDYEVKILQVPDAPLVNPQPLNTLVHDFSGSSYHYNADFSSSVRYALIVSADVEKSFAPKTINPGGTSTLTFSLTNPGPEEIVDVSLVDNFPVNMEIEGTSVTYTNCGSFPPSPASLTDGDTTLSFDDITIIGYGTCEIEVTVTVPAEFADQAYTNITENMFIGADDTGNNATDTLSVTSKPDLVCGTKDVMATWATFANGPQADTPLVPDVDTNTTFYTTSPGFGTSSIVAETLVYNAVWPILPGGSTNAYFEFSVDSTNYGSLEISLQPALLVNGDWAANNNNHIYVSSSIDGINFSTPVATSISKGSFQPAIITQATTTGAFTTWFRITVDTAKVLGANAALDNVIISGCPRPELPTMSKSFDPTSVTVGGTSTLTFNFANPNASVLTAVGFTDTLPTGLLVAALPNVTGPSCSLGSITVAPTITAAAGTTLIEMTGATLAANSTCSFTVDVEGDVAGDYTNTSDTITSLETGPNTTGGVNVGYGESSLKVFEPPVIAKAFGAGTIFVNDTTTLSFTITNLNALDTLNGIGFSDSLPDTGNGDIIIATPNGLVGSCGGGTITAVAGSTSVSLSGATLTGGSSCNFSVDVVGTAVGTKINTTSVVTSTEGGDGNTATDTIVVDILTPAISLLKQVGPTITGPWTDYMAVSLADDVYYRFTVENTGDVDLISVNISDPDLDGLIPTTANCAWEDGEGNSLTAAFPLPLADLDEEHIATCILGAYAADALGLINTAMTSNGSGATNVSDTAEYAITELSLDKSVTSGDPYSATGDIIEYSYLVTNTGGADLAGPVTVADNKATVSCPAIADGVLSPLETLTCTATYTVTDDDIGNGSITNIATATIENGGGGNEVISNSDTVTVYPAPPTAVTIAKVELDAVPTSDFLVGLGVSESSTDTLWALLAAWDPDLAASLTDEDSQTLQDALTNYLDPDGDGQTAVIRWDTLEERGTIGFYVERRAGDDEWERINNDLLPGLITAPMGGEYQLADPSAEAGITYEYQLIEQEARGTTQTYGPFKLEIE